ncbi:hypothetical protein G6F70_005380 [Rhizopus microsporus]|nr:hypothetical protein G6F71_007534 [Rhizopus microsporus]KAG1198939.1 hypothetical protein G6F70_005380 [Rhizopus microsporus]KAG1211637.1 hypothetical protein G6F69_004418 [Rhizopus microsporus]KAG1232480.1 hypothetical protein G6F67_004998 [Rhizopus microsporus]KAG1261158.1 hypothetical protein G6F68_006887 [Rhizopus microsporus]
MLKRLFQQFLVDTWAIYDQNKLDWIRQNQYMLHIDVYSGIADAIAESDQINEADLGRRFILSSSFHGGPCFMSKLHYDSMAIVRHFGKPSLFITFMTNTKWAEITMRPSLTKLLLTGPTL